MLVSFTPLHLFATTLKVQGSAEDNKLYVDLIKEIVSRSDQYDSLDFIYAKTGEPAGSRVYADIQSGALDLMWSATNLDLEKKFTPIHFPIFRGMLGMRIGLIHKKNAQMLASVKNIEDMKQFKICSGKTWPDTSILDANQLVTAKSLKYPNIFEMMLAGNRCDLFARGVMEPFNEMAARPELPLAVDQYVMLNYKMPFLYFVSKDNQALANHVLGIIEDIFEDGTYETLFFNDSEVKAVFSKANLNNRTIIELNNPYLTAEARQIPAKYFYNPLK